MGAQAGIALAGGATDETTGKQALCSGVFGQAPPHTLPLTRARRHTDLSDATPAHLRRTCAALRACSCQSISLDSETRRDVSGSSLYHISRHNHCELSE